MLASSKNSTDNLEPFSVFTDRSNTEHSSKNGTMWDVLIVDDEQDVHRMTKMVLRNYSFLGKKLNFHSAYSAQEAKELLKTNDSIALVLLDVVMEERNAGLKLVEFIRQDMENDSIRIIIRTGQPGEAPEETVIHDYVINDYIEKGDITTRRLYTTITTSLRGYRDLIALKESIQDLKEISQELNQAYARLATLDNEKARIIQFLYHELLTPLNHVGASQVFEEYELSAQNRATLEMVKRGFNRLNDLIKAFMHYFEFMGSDLELKPESLSISACLPGILAEYKRAIDKANLCINTDLSLLDTVVFDPGYFTDVISIVLGNAVKHSDNDGQIRIRSLISENGNCQIVVEDHGLGIPEQNLEKVFHAYDLESYYRREGGFGLNLSKARYIIESHGGKIWAESEGLGKGSCFFIELPARS